MVLQGSGNGRDVRNSGDAMDPCAESAMSASRAVWTSGRGRSSVCLFAGLLAKAHFRLGHGENRGGGLMTDATAKFFDALVERGHEPLLEKATGTLRFDLKDGKRTDRWLVAVVRGTSRSRAGICGQTASLRRTSRCLRTLRAARRMGWRCCAAR